MTQKLLLIDGFNLLSRGYFATSYGKEPEQLTRNEQGRYTGALRVFFSKLFQLRESLGITHIIVAWDGKREDNFRNDLTDTYKAQRTDLPEPLIDQYLLALDLLEKMDVHQLHVPRFEADDIIGALTTKWSNEEIGSSYIYSNDRDLLQLLNESTTQIFVKKKEEIHYSYMHFKEEYGIEPSQWVDVKALLGDPSDNIPGCPGVGEKSALPLIQEYGTIEELYENIDELDPAFKRNHKKLIAGEASTRLSKQLAKIVTEIPNVYDVSMEELAFTIAGREEELAKLLAENGLRINVR
ncbi:5'-3' exonuclease [Paenalkalicoccus suaedae]|uniref:5'-3' exonuclease n=1 Tax=Paenalkalicoccus suaedae TaxID=2592382 RepID=A0A859FGB5_9BACI|nr:5'-3' exonuclease [Paenalkalicoccus suaedae]QKS71245.1 5'-3' exonuclease [Paenalkalicoccus suaedae]